MVCIGFFKIDNGQLIMDNCRAGGKIIVNYQLSIAKLRNPLRPAMDLKRVNVKIC